MSRSELQYRMSYLMVSRSLPSRKNIGDTGPRRVHLQTRLRRRHGVMHGSGEIRYRLLQIWIVAGLMDVQQKLAATESSDPRIQRSVSALRNALLELLVDKTFDRISITELTARAGLSYTTFFRHFASKEALLNDVASSLIQDLLSLSVPVVSRAGRFASCRALCFYVHGKKELWRSLLTGGAAQIVQAEFVRQARLWTPNLHWPHDWLPVDLGIIWSARGTIHILSWWLEHEQDLSIDEVARILDRLVVQSISLSYPDKPRARRSRAIKADLPDTGGPNRAPKSSA